MVEFRMQDIEALQNLVSTGVEDEDDHVYGSALNPSSLHSGKDKKEIAKPNA